MTQDLSRVVLVTGPSGAGRTTAINALEDFGYEAIDNIPLSLIPRLIDAAPGNPARPLALGIDVRNRDFSAQGLIDLHASLQAHPDRKCDLLYLDCSAEVLIRRYSETRRRHPMAPDDSPADGVARELALLTDVRARADVMINSSELTVHDLRAQMEGWFAPATGQGMALSLHSFSYKRGIPQGLDMAFDCRFLRNPHWDRALRPLTGRDPAVAAYVAQDSRFEGYVARLVDLLLFALPGTLDEGKTHFSAGFGCTGGQHRSVAIAEKVAAALEQAGWQVSTRHRELERRGMMPTAASDEKSVGKAPK